MEFGPAVRVLGCVVQINQVTPVHHLATLGDIHLGMTLSKPRQKVPCCSCVNTPLAEKAAVCETAASHNLADNMQLHHIINIHSCITLQVGKGRDKK